MTNSILYISKLIPYLVEKPFSKTIRLWCHKSTKLMLLPLIIKVLDGCSLKCFLHRQYEKLFVFYLMWLFIVNMVYLGLEPTRANACHIQRQVELYVTEFNFAMFSNKTNAHLHAWIRKYVNKLSTPEIGTLICENLQWLLILRIL